MTLWPDFFFFFNWDHLNYDPGKEFLYNLQFWAATPRVLWVNYYKKSLFLFVAILSSLAIVRRSLRSWVGWKTCRSGPIYKRHRWWMITYIDVLGSILKMINIMLGFSSHVWTLTNLFWFMKKLVDQSWRSWQMLHMAVKNSPTTQTLELIRFCSTFRFKGWLVNLAWQISLSPLKIGKIV